MWQHEDTFCVSLDNLKEPVVLALRKKMNVLSKEINNSNNSSEESSDGSEDEFNPTLAAMETEIKPKVLKTVSNLTKEYNKLIKYQKEKRVEVNKIIFSKYMAALSSSISSLLPNNLRKSFFLNSA